jgi:hypothetical protein
MKSILIFSISLIPLHILAQESSVGLRNEFSQISKYTYGRQSGFEGLQSFSSKQVRGSQFYFPSWSGGSLTVDSNEVTASNYLFLYDKVRQELFMQPKDSAVVLQADKGRIRGFSLVSNGTHNFEVASNYNPDDKTDFFEVLIKNDNSYTLLKLVKTKFVKFDPTDMMRVKSGDTYDEFQDDISYFVSYKHELPKPVKLNDNSMKKALAADKSKVDSYINENYNSERNESFLVGLVNSLDK